MVNVEERLKKAKEKLTRAAAKTAIGVAGALLTLGGFSVANKAFNLAVNGLQEKGLKDKIANIEKNMTASQTFVNYNVNKVATEDFEKTLSEAGYKLDYGQMAFQKPGVYQKTVDIYEGKKNVGAVSAEMVVLDGGTVRLSRLGGVFVAEGNENLQKTLEGIQGTQKAGTVTRKVDPKETVATNIMNDLQKRNLQTELYNKMYRSKTPR